MNYISYIYEIRTQNKTTKLDPTRQQKAKPLGPSSLPSSNHLHLTSFVHINIQCCRTWAVVHST